MIQSIIPNTQESQTHKELMRIITKTSAQHYHHRNYFQQILKDSLKKPTPLPTPTPVRKKKQSNKKWWRKGFDCLINFFQCRSHFKEKSKIFVKSENLLQTLQKLRNPKQKDGLKYLPKLKINKKTLVIDLQGTFVYSNPQKIQDYNFKLDFEAEGTEIRMFSKIRPGTQIFFEQMSELYEIVLFTSCEKEQARAILANICKPGQVKHQLYRENCLNLNQIYFLKQMNKLNRDQTKVVFVDCHVETGVLQPLNFHQITRYKGNSNDRQLQKLASFLKWLAKKEVVTPIFKNYEAYLQEVMQFNKSYYDKEDRIMEQSCLIRRSPKRSFRISINDRVMTTSRFKEEKDNQRRVAFCQPSSLGKQQPLKIQLELSEISQDFSESKTMPIGMIKWRSPLGEQVNNERQENGGSNQIPKTHHRNCSELNLIATAVHRPNENDNSDSLMIKQSTVFRQQI